MRPLLITSLLVALAGLGPTAAHAQVPDSATSFQVEIFEPQPAQGVNLLNLVKSDVMQHLYPSFGVFVQYVDDPFELARQADPDVVLSRLVESQLKVEPWAAFGLFDRVDIGIVLPLIVSQSGQSLSFFNRDDAVEGFSMGDLRVIPKVRLLDPEIAYGFGISLAANLYLPTGDTNTFNSYGSVRFKPTLAVDWRNKGGGFAIVANIGYMFQPKTTAHNLVLDDSLHWGFGIDIPLLREQVKVLATVHGVLALSENRDPSNLAKKLDDGLTSPIETDLALQFRIADDFVLQVGGGVGITSGVGAPDFRAFLSFGYTPVTYDRDGDGILDRVDKCPDVPEDKDGFEDEDGCPDFDNDRDGVLDVSDGALDFNGFGVCRDQPEDKDRFEDEDGCPDPDNDKDGVLDVSDGARDATGFGACRNQPEDKDGFEDDDGCPDDDNDKDGVSDANDGPPDPGLAGFGQCRNDPEDKDGFQDQDGCPDPDNDKDGVLDVVDGPKDASGFGSCRDVPETINGYADEDGCPDTEPKRVKVTQFQIEISDKIFFDYNKATIQPVSFGLLDEVASVLVQHPQLSKIRIEGHTDFHGDDAYNLKLSQERADAVMAYLVGRGIALARMESQGWGEQKPLIPGPAGRTNDGRAKNRRVEFHIIEVNGQPHSPEKPVIIEKHEVVP